jgi:aromatic-L-amino-acid/L-tryptophan decarboxylase
VLGFGPAQLRVLPVDDEHRLRPRVLAGAMEADAAAGRRPLFVAANGGSTNSGSVDPLDELAAIAHEHGAWFHVDAAYGGFAVLDERGRAELAGIELADSVTLDPHKWLYQPYECGCLLVREAGALSSAFAITPDYLRDSEPGEEEVNFADRGLQLTRTSRALKVWVSLRYFGLDAFRAAVARSLDLAALAARRVQESDVLELAAPPSLGIVCLRRSFAEDEDERNAGLVAALEHSGLGLVSSTRLRGRYAIRLCPLNHTTTATDVERVLAFLETAEPEPVVPLERDREVRRSWLRAPRVDPSVLAAIPLFASLDPADLTRVARMVHLRDAAPGEHIVEQWTTSRDFYAILDGAVDVLIDDEVVNTLRAGDFFGEIAAIEWAAGYSYPRIATVVAVEPLRLLVFPDGTLSALVAEFPEIDAVVREAVEERLPRR